MAILKKMNAAAANKDADPYFALYGEEAVFSRHKSGSEMGKADLSEMIRRMWTSDQTNMSARHCVYTKDDILVTHSVNAKPRRKPEHYGS